MNLINSRKFIKDLRRAATNHPLRERERSILYFRYGLGADMTIHTMKETATMFGVTEERIRQINNRTIEKLGIKREGYIQDDE